MSLRILIVAAALFAVAEAAHAGFAAALPESASVALVFVALAAIGFIVSRKKKVVDEDRSDRS